MQRLFSRAFTSTALFLLTLVLACGTAMAQYNIANLDSNTGGKAKHKDPLLVNAWGLAYSAGNPFWVSDEGDGWSTLYDGHGTPQSLQVVIPAASPTGIGSPTGIVSNASNEFQVEGWASLFIFATLDGTISGWAPLSNPTKSIIAVNNSGSGASYTGLAITSKTSGNTLFAADFNNNKVDMYDGNFSLIGSFTDTDITGFAPFGIQDINGQVYVAFAATSGGPGGVIDIFNEDGTFVKHLVHGSLLNQPWGIAMAPSNFGPLSNTLLISNNIDFKGTINGFDPNTGALVGTVRNTQGKPIFIDQLWGIEFGGGTLANGMTNQLFFTAGPNNNLNGGFGVIALK